MLVRYHGLFVSNPGYLVKLVRNYRTLNMLVRRHINWDVCFPEIMEIYPCWSEIFGLLFGHVGQNSDRFGHLCGHGGQKSE